MKEIAEMRDTTEKALYGVLERRWRKVRERLKDGEEGERKP